MEKKQPVLLCILDGWGLRTDSCGNAIAAAHTPNFDRIMESCPNATLVTHGNAVGLPNGLMGNSEVGHLHIGAGRTVWMDLQRIDNAIADESIFDLETLEQFISRVTGTVHLVGIVSDGGVHGHLRHFAPIAQHMVRRGMDVAFHAITDGRDTPPRSAAGFLESLRSDLPESVRIVSVCGRYFAMDRDRRWERVAKACALFVSGSGRVSNDAGNAVADAYDRGETDEFIHPTAMSGYEGIQAGDGIFFLNFRADRARELVAALCDPGFDEYERPDCPNFSALLGMTSYFGSDPDWFASLFAKQRVENALGAWVASSGLTQFRVAETEKYPHVTFFLNGGREEPERGEDRHMAPSPRVATYDLMPEMSADEVTRELTAAIRRNYDLIVANFANPDMVGHTGDLRAAIIACEAVDKGLGAVVQEIEAAGGTMLLTADHGNCETMTDPETGQPHTAHTTNPVPVALIGGPQAVVGLRDGRLSDIAPTLLDLLNLTPPDVMTGKSLLIRDRAEQ